MNKIASFSFEYAKGVQSIRAELLTRTVRRHLSKLGGVDSETVENAQVDIDSFVFEKTAGMKQSSKTNVLLGMPSHGSYLSEKSILVATQPLVEQILQSEASWAKSSQHVVSAIASLLSKLDKVIFLDRSASDASIGFSHYAQFDVIDPFPVYLAPHYDASSVKALIIDFARDGDDVSQYLPKGMEFHRLSDATTVQEALDLIQTCQIHIHTDYRGDAGVDVIGPLDSFYNGFFTVLCPSRADKKYHAGDRVAYASVERSYCSIVQKPEMLEQVCTDFKNRLQLTSQQSVTIPPEIFSSKMRNEAMFQNTRQKLEKMVSGK